MTDLMTAVETWIQTQVQQGLADALPQIKASLLEGCITEDTLRARVDALFDLRLSRLDPKDIYPHLEDDVTRIVNNMDLVETDDLDRAIHDYINDNVTVSLDC